VQDEALVAAAQRGDRQAFARLVELHQAGVYGYLRARLLRAHDAEDLTQEVFLRCYTSWARFDGSAQVRPWLLGIARNLLHEYARKQRRRKETAWTETCLEVDEVVSSQDDVYGDLVDHLRHGSTGDRDAVPERPAFAGDRREAPPQRGRREALDVSGSASAEELSAPQARRGEP
jgi:RNA polymerase sigma factor (sigma-70 family)